MILGIIGVVLSRIATKEIAKRNENGKGLAIFGLICNVIGIIIQAFAVFSIIPSLIKGISGEKFFSLFNKQNNKSVIDIINILNDTIPYFFVISALFLMIVFLYRAFSKSKKRIQLLIIVMETLIQEIEKEQSSS